MVPVTPLQQITQMQQELKARDPVHISVSTIASDHSDLPATVDPRVPHPHGNSYMAFQRGVLSEMVVPNDPVGTMRSMVNFKVKLENAINGDN